MYVRSWCEEDRRACVVPPRDGRSPRNREDTRTQPKPPISSLYARSLVRNAAGEGLSDLQPHLPRSFLCLADDGGLAGTGEDAYAEYSPPQTRVPLLYRGTWPPAACSPAMLDRRSIPAARRTCNRAKWGFCQGLASSTSGRRQSPLPTCFVVYNTILFRQTFSFLLCPLTGVRCKIAFSPTPAKLLQNPKWGGSTGSRGSGGREEGREKESPFRGMNFVNSCQRLGSRTASRHRSRCTL